MKKTIKTPKTPPVQVTVFDKVEIPRIPTYIKEFLVDIQIGDYWTRYADTGYRANAIQISDMLKACGEKVRLSELHEGSIIME